MTDTLVRLILVAVAYCAAVLTIALVASLAVSLIAAALHDWRTLQRLRRSRGRR